MLAKRNRPAVSGTELDVPRQSADDTKELVRAIAMDIGKEVVHHIETMMPHAALSPSNKLSIRNTVHNEIMDAISVTDEGRIVARLKERKAFRRKIKRMYQEIRAGEGK